MRQSIPELSMPTHAKIVGQHVHRATSYEWLSDSRPDRNASLLCPLKDATRCCLLDRVSGRRANIIFHRLEYQFPFLNELAFVILELADHQQLLTHPTRSLYKGSVIISNSSRNRSHTYLHQIQLP